MNGLIEIMEKINAWPASKSEWVAAAADTTGVVVTAAWISGMHQTIDGALHTAIAAFTLLSVCYSLYTKFKPKKKNDERKDK